jgi:hypothetical protein
MTDSDYLNALVKKQRKISLTLDKMIHKGRKMVAFSLYPTIIDTCIPYLGYITPKRVRDR